MEDAQGSTARAAHAWLKHRGRSVLEIQPVAGDVSPRHYVRARFADEPEAIVAYYPDDPIDAFGRFMMTTRLLAAQDVRVPEIIDHDQAAGWMLVEDLGDQTLFDRGGDWDALRPFYEDAFEQIRRIQTVPMAAVEPLNPPLDVDLLRQELAQTQEWFLGPRFGLSDRETRSTLDRICADLARVDAVVCHRDLMARNLVPLGGTSGTGGPGDFGRRVGILDHQDLRMGPRFYDLASLLNDSLFTPAPLEAAWLRDWVETDEEHLAYRRTVAQRTLKALGTFARCAARGSDKHEALIPPTLARAREVLKSLPEGCSLADRMECEAETDDRAPDSS